jgi:hypothetical protein
MDAEVGDWLVVKSHREGGHARRAAILAVRAGGGTPYTVRWLDDGREALVFPGPDAEVISAKQQVELDRAQVQRITVVQSAILAESKSAE